VVPDRQPRSLGLLAAGAHPGRARAELTGACAREETGNATAAQDSLRFEVIGYENLTVAAAAVETLHVRLTGTGTGGTESTRTYDTWLLPAPT